MVVTILGNTNTLPEKYRIAQYADPPYQLQPLVFAFRDTDRQAFLSPELGNQLYVGPPEFRLCNEQRSERVPRVIRLALR